MLPAEQKTDALQNFVSESIFDQVETSVSKKHVHQVCCQNSFFYTGVWQKCEKGKIKTKNRKHVDFTFLL